MIQTLLLALSVSIDAFSVSITQGSSNHKSVVLSALVTSIFFGFFQAIMPIVGWFIGKEFTGIIIGFDHWTAFILLTFVGIRMIGNSFKKNRSTTNKLDFKNLLILSVATSIDALVVGITFAFTKVSINLVIISFGGITFIMSLMGFFMGKRLRNIVGKKMEIIGGIILILIGFKILLEHLFN